MKSVLPLFDTQKPLMFLLGWGILILLLAFMTQAQNFYVDGSPILRTRLEVQEAFQAGGGGASIPPPADMGEEAGPGLAPGNPELNKAAQPYSLLADWLPGAAKPAYPSAQVCHEVDFQTRLEPTGNFRQLTNNYKRGDPDSCSAPIQDMTLAFYKNEPVAFGGCMTK